MNKCNKIFTVYTRLLKKHSLVVQSIQTGLIMGIGDLAAQTVIENKPLEKVELLRTAQFVALGTGLVGPILTAWYKFLSKTIGDTGKAAVLKKVAADQLIFAPNFIVVFITTLNMLQGKNLENVKKELSSKYKDILITNYKVWPAVQILNFYLVPLHYQVLFVQTVAVFWNAYMSWKTQQ
ncbi:hypothetical protein NQ317_010045 [Molorchus minor]|uniref:Mitochondrial inner membrane protein Mpv17 n=1 Tax=Molorchus minor TaxID=1323400 RepID=A0ABQ9J6A8_9CUCU|nr:hypothetical protein NQ317_010045 [Molorchus minor]